MSTLSAPIPPSSVALASPSPVSPVQRAELVERGFIDASTRAPALIFFATAIAWLMVATLLGLIATVKLQYPDFLGGWSFLSYGRLQPAFTNALTYGWGCLAGLGMAVWLMARLCRTAIAAPGSLVYGGLLWNVGVAVGVVSILLGEARPYEGLEMPRFAHGLMFIGFMLVGLWGAVLYRYRRQSGPSFISVWYLLGALFWFPWTFAFANLLGSSTSVRGVMQPIIAAWYAQNLNGWWFTALGLAAAYFFIPKVIDRPVFSYHLARLGFWTFALFSGLTGMVRLSGGPVPAWLVTVSIAASIMLLVPVCTVSVNLLTTMAGKWDSIFHSPTMRFTIFGVFAFIVSSLLGIASAPRSIDSILHFTPFYQGQQHLLLYSFFSMAMFGAIYYITPRLVECEWLSSSLINFHFFAVAYGGCLLAACLLLAGIAQGLTISDPETNFTQVFLTYRLFVWGRIIGWLMIALGHAVFALHFLLMLLRIGQPSGEATLFPVAEEGH